MEVSSATWAPGYLCPRPLSRPPVHPLRQGPRLCHVRAQHPGGNRTGIQSVFVDWSFRPARQLPVLSCNSRLSLLLPKLELEFSPRFLNAKMISKHPRQLPAEEEGTARASRLLELCGAAERGPEEGPRAAHVLGIHGLTRTRTGALTGSEISGSY